MKVQGDGIAVMSWSPDDTMLVICGRDENSDAMIYSVEVSVNCNEILCHEFELGFLNGLC